MVLWDSIVGSLLGKVAPKVAEYYQKKLELKYQYKLTKWESKIRRAEAAEQRDHEWEQMQIRNSGWKDEYVLILLSIPLVGVFIPGLQPYILQGFQTLGQTPQWYQWLIVLIFTAVYGIRVWRRKPNE